MSENDAPVRADVLNADAAKSRAARTAEVARAPRRAASKSAPKRAAKPAPKPAPRPSGRSALSPKERAAKPMTANVATYVEWLNREVYGGKMSAAQKSAAGVSLTLYGGYQARKNGRAA